MRITFNHEEKLFHIENDQISYVISILRNGHLGHCYFGEKLKGPLRAKWFRKDQNRGLTVYTYEGDMNFSLNMERLEYPCHGTGDYRGPAFDLLQNKGSRISDFVYKEHRVFNGKSDLVGMPATWTDQDDDAMTLEIDLIDAVLNLKLTLSYAIFRGLSVIARHVKIQNDGSGTVQIDSLMSMSIDLFDSQWEWVQLSGEWIRERHMHAAPLRPGIQSIGSTRGASSAEHNPFVMLKRPEATEELGEVLGVSLVYSGNFRIQGNVNFDGQTRLTAGIHPDGFAWELKPGAVFQTPEALVAHSKQGVGALSRTYHDLFRKHLIPQKWIHQERPVLINNWEATYFDFNEEIIMGLAQEAKNLGIELFVLDDGWFGTRNDDTQGLGDWYANTSKLPSGIKGLAERITDLGIGFGLWIEPEMVNKNSELYRLHPEWLVCDPERRVSHARNQYVLDYSRKEVVDAIFDQLVRVLDDAKVSYIKWDMNRNITEAFSTALGSTNQGELFHRYILGVYDLYNRLTKRYPDILFESCASGGGRFDPALLYYAPQAWASDNTDAVTRLKIQYGTSMVYPLSSMGSHVSAVPNHQVLRNTPLKARGDVAYFGTFGYELDVTRMSDSDKAVMSEQVHFFKKHRTLIHHGDFYRLISPFEGDGNRTAWMVVSKDKRQGLAAWYQPQARPNEGLFKIRLKGLEPEQMYKVTDQEFPMSGQFLMQHGLLLAPSFNGVSGNHTLGGDYQSRLWEIEAV